MRLGDIDQLIGETILSYSDGSITCASGRRFEIDIEDDGCGGNDSHAYLDGSDVEGIYGKTITAAYPKDYSSYGVLLTFEAGDQRGWIQITHEHNGYYGFSYDVREVK